MFSEVRKCGGSKSVLRCTDKEGCDESVQHTPMIPPGAEDGSTAPTRLADEGSRRLRAVEPVEARTTPRTPERLPHNLPLELSSFIGRDREVAEVKRLVSNNRVLTLTGSGDAARRA